MGWEALPVSVGGREGSPKESGSSGIGVSGQEVETDTSTKLSTGFAEGAGAH